MSHFIDGLNHGKSVGKPKNNSLLRKKNLKGVIPKQKGTRMAEDGEDSNGLEMILKLFDPVFFFFFSKYTNDDVAPLKNTMESRFSELPRGTKIPSKNQDVLKIGGKISVS